MSDSYYGQPIIKRPVWTWEIPAYLFSGGLAGASSLVAAGARIRGDRGLADRAAAVAAASAVVSPALLSSDLGRPERFHHMLRVFRPTSPMNMGSWLLAAYVPAAVGAWLLGRNGRSGLLHRAAESVAGVLGPGVATYTSVLIADTAVPVWHEGRRELPFLFAGDALSASGSLLTLITNGDSPLSRTLAMAGTTAELAASWRMQHRLGGLARPYREGRAGRFTRAATLTGGLGLAVTGLARGRRIPRLVGAALMLAASILERWAVFRAGFQSAEDPEYTVGPQARHRSAARQEMELEGGPESRPPARVPTEARTTDRAPS